MGDPKDDIRKLLSKKPPRRKQKAASGPLKPATIDFSDSDDSEKNEVVVCN